MEGHTFNPPPGWPAPPPGWRPPDGWKLDPSWPAPPDGWQLWLSDTSPSAPVEPIIADPTPPPPPQTMAPPSSGDSVVAGLRAEVVRLTTELDVLRARAATGADDLVELDDERVLQEVGIYNYHHPLENAEAFKGRLATLQQHIKEMVLAKDAILASDMFVQVVNNAVIQGNVMNGTITGSGSRAG